MRSWWAGRRRADWRGRDSAGFLQVDPRPRNLGIWVFAVRALRANGKGPGEVDRRGLAASFSPGGLIKAAAPTIAGGRGNLTSIRRKKPRCHFRAIAT